MTAVFFRSAAEASAVEAPRVPLRYLLEFALDGETPGRVLNDQGVRSLMPYLRGPGTLVELGGVGDYYKNFAPDQPYTVTNFQEPCDQLIDMTKMDFADNSVDAFLSMFALEHIYDFQTVIEECFRSLKPGGRMLLGVPWMYYYHGAPDDFFRFSVSALDEMLQQWNVLRKVSFGNRNLLVCQLFHEKKALGHHGSWPVTQARRLMTMPFLMAGLLGNQHSPVYAITQLYLCEKPVTTW
jgi:SAM-dependent methyltransferase